MLAAQMLSAPFANHADLFAAHAAERPQAVSLVDDDGQLTWRELGQFVDAVAARLQREGMRKGDAVAIVGANSIPYAVAFLAALQIGAAAAPLTSSASPDALTLMLADSGARHLFADADKQLDVPAGVTRVDLARLASWGSGAPSPVSVEPSDPFNIIYSSGTTGTPKGIVQSHAMRWAYLQRNLPLGYSSDCVTINATPLYSNTTLVSFFPTLATGGRVVLMKKFDARRFLELAERERATHAMLVPVQYRRIMALPDFDRFDLSSFRMKTCTSAPFSADLKADIVKRWPGALVEFYGMTEGGASCVLLCNQYPDKLHTVGQVAEGSEIRLIDEEGQEVAPGEVGEVCGRGPAMMSGYHNRAKATEETMWTSPEGERFIRQGDVGRFDADGFLTLMDRRKDVIISGGFNIYPSDLEAVLAALPGVEDVAVVGVPHSDWGETPVAFAVLQQGTDCDALLAAANARLGRTQRLAALHSIDHLPRSAIGKVLKRELRERLAVAKSG